MKKEAEVTPQPCVCTSAASDVLDKSPSLALGFIFPCPMLPLGKKHVQLVDLQWACYMQWVQGNHPSFSLLLLPLAAAWKFLRDGLTGRRCGR